MTLPSSVVQRRHVPRSVFCLLIQPLERQSSRESVTQYNSKPLGIYQHDGGCGLET